MAYLGLSSSSICLLSHAMCISVASINKRIRLMAIKIRISCLLYIFKNTAMKIFININSATGRKTKFWADKKLTTFKKLTTSNVKSK